MSLRTGGERIVGNKAMATLSKRCLNDQVVPLLGGGTIHTPTNGRQARTKWGAPGTAPSVLARTKQYFGYFYSSFASGTLKLGSHISPAYTWPAPIIKFTWCMLLCLRLRPDSHPCVSLLSRVSGAGSVSTLDSTHRRATDAVVRTAWIGEWRQALVVWRRFQAPPSYFLSGEGHTHLMYFVLSKPGREI